ncbi:phosphotransferase [uncultured Hyphomonas sp.]|uniref:phosphotransferase family protein n=1 Tax=uncultured Hyphomonas sp. TaxID=225298 RepID=UPI002AAAF2B8|nr:phosphotransferase [uncultured Hyphomonas sp.]
MPIEANRQPGFDGEHTIPEAPDTICDALRELGLASTSDAISGEPLSGGVSSDIWRIDLPGGPVCAKRALAKLKVAEDWFAPTNRIDFEAAYYRFASAIEAEVTPAVLGHHPELGVLITEYLSPSTHTVWKEELRDGVIRPGHIHGLGQTLRRLHDASEADPRVAEKFNQPDLIHALRLSPYFLASIPANHDLDAQLSELVTLFEENSRWLIHGDFSPKNILFGPHHPVILDAECANLGDAAFDLAFCCAHLFLKAAWKPQSAAKFEEAFEAFRNSYFAAGDDPELEARAARYLAGFLLARMDGKSPVEYITAPADKARIRAFARKYLTRPAASLSEPADTWFPVWADPSNSKETQN